MLRRFSKTFRKEYKKEEQSDERPRHESSDTNIAQPGDLQGRLGLILLYDGRGWSPNGIDIVAVHGLRGHPTKSFTEPSGNFCWLRDFLPSAIPGCRVFSYGYESTELPGTLSTISTLSRNFLYDLRSKLDGENESPRSLVFIGHNLGGLLIKSLLVQATLESGEKSRAIVERTAGILFFGTPHHGSSAADMASVLARIVRATGSTNLMRQMSTNSDFLQELGRDFNNRVASRNIRIFSFYETRLTRNISMTVVDRSSATLGLPTETLIALNSDHANLCKFYSTDEPQYRIVKNVLEELSSEERHHESRELPPTNTATIDSLSDWVPNVVCKRGKTTKGLIEMAGSMDEPRNFRDAEFDIVAVHGLGGSSYKSWINDSARTLWLRDFLQRDYPNARVMSYGYKADAAITNGTLDISILASDMLENIIEARSQNEEGESRPLILIGYSFGGLLIKKALLLLRDGYTTSPVFQSDILENLAHIIFLGVPHEDSGVNSQWAEIIQCTARIKALDSFNIPTSREQINEITKEFRRFRDLDSASIAESEPTRIPQSKKKVLLVSATSVQLGWGDRETIFVSRNRNHLELPTFVDAEDPSYVFIRETVAKALSSLGSGMMSEEEEACLRLLQRTQLASSRMLDNIRTTTDGLCGWIFDTTEMTSWLKNPDGTLLIRGPPGCGKSVLAKYLISELPIALAPKATRALYHLCDWRDENHRPESVLASLLYQIFQERPSLIQHAISAFRSMGDEFTSSPEVLIGIFLTIREDITEHIIIVLDGVDMNLPGLLKLTHRLRQSGSVGFILTTRINTVGAEEDVISIDWKSKFPMSNMHIFLEKELEKMNVDDSLKELITKKMLEQSSSSFLWVVLVLHQLKESPSSSETIQRALSSVPGQLKESYDTIFQQLEGESSGKDWILFYEVLKLMVVSQRPLKLGAYVDALNIRPERHESYEGFTSSQLQQIFSKNASFFHQDSSGHLRFVHQSVKEYLISPESEMRITQISLAEAHFSMAQKCVAQIHGTLGADITACDVTSFHETFTEYASTSWMVHFSSSKDLGRDVSLLDSVYKLFNFPDNLSAPTQWLLLYEHATSETLPRHKVFGPLFGGAYFGLLPIVEKALEIGADIEAQDDGGKTALHWASERGHAAVVSTLLLGGANVNNVTYGGWSSLHLAALKGDNEMVSLLLEHGADVNLESGDGRSPLHCAVEAGRVEVIQKLLMTGADVTRRSYTGVSIIYLAQSSSSDESLQVLMKSTAAEALLSRSIFDNDLATLELLFKWRLDVIIQSYPWVGELIDEKCSETEISDLLLKSENLDWMADTEDAQYRSKNNWKLIAELEHHDCCAHHLSALNSDTNAQKDNLAEGQAEVKLSMGEISLGDSSSVDSTSSKSHLLDPEHHFDKLEEREQELIKICGIGGVFAPEHRNKSGRINPGYGLMRRHAAQIMYGASSELNNILPIDITTDIPALQYPENHNNFNSSRKDIDAESLRSISTRGTETSDSSYDSTSNEENFEIWGQDSARMIVEALENVLNAIEYLHDEGECCDRFSIIVKPLQRSQILELRTIHSKDLTKLCSNLEVFCEPSDTKPSGWTNPLAHTCQQILSGIGYGELASEHIKGSLGSSKTPSPNRCLHLCALIAQIASIGLVTYSRGHSREFYTSQLTRPVDFFILGGLESYWPSVCAERVELSCMGKMLGRKVWMFQQDKRAMGTFKDPFFLSANIEDILDTWGGWISIQKDEVNIHTGGGSIRGVEDDRGKEMITYNEVFCHWYSDTDDSVPLRVPSIPPGARLLIGATQVNTQCPLTSSTFQEAIAHKLVTLGTRPPSWKTTGRSLGISGGHWGASASLSASQTKDDGRNLKKRLVDGYQQNQDLRKLNIPWGLELSLCTGIARRVLLRHLMYGEALEYLELGLPGEWKEIKDIAPSLPEKSDAEFEKLLKDLTKEQAAVLRKAVELLIIAMESTGVEKDGHTLTLWWPEKDESSPRGLCFTKSQYSGISMIRDSEHCAVFGMVTMRCLQHDNIKKCRQNAQWSWQDVDNIMLDTTLIPAEKVGSLPYAKDERYLLWKRQDSLKVTEPSALTGVVQLKYYSGWTRPPIVMRSIKKYEKVKERQGLKDSGQGVLIL